MFLQLMYRSLAPNAARDAAGAGRGLTWESASSERRVPFTRTVAAAHGRLPYLWPLLFIGSGDAG